MIYPVILCGGSGTRLWPSSRKSFPKQFSNLIGEESLFQATLRRMVGPEYLAPIILTNTDFRFLVTDQAASVGLSDATILIEPEGRNTGPAVLTAALSLAKEPDAIMLVAASDHVIGNGPEFAKAVEAGAKKASEGQLVCIGIKPTKPETGYGYLELDGQPQDGEPLPVLSFREKPDEKTAESFLNAGNYLWNASIFIFRVRDILEAFRTYKPKMVSICSEALDKGKSDLNFFRLDKDAYTQAENISLDYAVMEKAKNITAVCYGGIWSDLGSWDAIWTELGPDADGVVTDGTATAINCENTLLRSDDDNIQLVGLGLKNIVAVAMRDAVLVADKDSCQSVKDVVNTLKAANVPQATEFPRFYRPWGWYETLCLGGRFQVKRIMVKPGGVLSLQSHVHRSEHWVVVAGTAKVTVSDDVKLLSENQSVYIPLGAVHRMENPGKVDMVLIEVQTGSYLGEDDIERYEDIYARSSKD
jgi:mannose-1-phosphate guanylyltransferase/mannose-6-phosphate isomerase